MIVSSPLHLTTSPTAGAAHPGVGSARLSSSCIPGPQKDCRRQRRPPRRCYSSALFMAGGGVGDGPPSGSRSISTSNGLVGGSSQQQAPSVPNTVTYNNETLVFGDYRRPSIAERVFITLAAFGTVGWRASFAFRGLRRTWSKIALATVSPLLAWLLRSVLSYVYKEIVLQPKLRSPESVAFHNSRFKDIDGLKVHYLRETPKVDGADVAPRCILHMNHGFGASSSSWTPVISSLSGALGALAVAHDTPGFGLTARTGIWRTNRYSLSNNAAITQDILRDATGELGAPNEAGANRPRSILMGHSMGCITAATAAVDPSLPAEQTTLILVAPALRRPSKNKNGRSALNAEAGAAEESVLRGGSGRPAGNVKTQKGASNVLGALIGAPMSVVRAVRDTGAWIFNWGLLPLFYPVEILALRALVYSGNFWRVALRGAWFDKSRVDLDAINRYRWPSLVRFWDRGMALFLLDRLQIGDGGTSGPPGLVEAVAAKAAQGMKVIIVQGEQDKIITIAKAKAIADAVKAKLVVMPECGHVPHEERPNEFIRLVLEHLSQEAATELKESETDISGRL